MARCHKLQREKNRDQKSGAESIQQHVIFHLFGPYIHSGEIRVQYSAERTTSDRQYRDGQKVLVHILQLLKTTKSYCKSYIITWSCHEAATEHFYFNPLILPPLLITSRHIVPYFAISSMDSFTISGRKNVGSIMS